MKCSFPIKRLLTVAGLSMALILPLSALARPPGGHGGLEMQIEQLELDDETRSSVDQILDEARTQRRALQRELRATREQLREDLVAVDSDEAILLAQVERISVLDLEMNKQRIATHLKLRAVLTSDQMASLAAAAAERPARPGRAYRK